MASEEPQQEYIPPQSTDDVIYSHTHSWGAEKRAKYSDYISTQKIDHQPLLAVGDHAVVESGDKILMVALKPQSSVRIREKKASLFGLVGRPFNATYLHDDNILKRRLEGKVSVEQTFKTIESKSLDTEFMPTTNNKDLVGVQGNQQLSWEEIQKLKESDLDANEIMKRVTGSSKTWDQKTEFSQMKWLQRKMGKYSRDIQIRQPTPCELLKITSKTDKNMLHYVRDDTLASILHMCNIGFGTRTIIIDGTDGLLTGAVQRKQADSGAVLQIHPDHRTNQAVIDMNLPKHVRQRIINLAFDSIPSFGWAEVPYQWTLYQRKQIENYYSENEKYKEEFPNAHHVVLPCMTLQAQNFLQHKALALIIIQQAYDPLSLLLPLLPHMLPSSPFVIYCQSMDRVTKIRSYLYKNQLAVNLTTYDMWFRPLQVLPNRTHPHMSMAATGGYLLMGFTIDYSIPETQKTDVQDKPVQNTTDKDDQTMVDAVEKTEIKEEKPQQKTIGSSLLHDKFQSTNDAYNYEHIVPPEPQPCKNEQANNENKNKNQNQNSQRHNYGQKRAWNGKSKK